MRLDDEAAQHRRFAPARELLAKSLLVQRGGVLIGRLLGAAELLRLRADATRAHAQAVEVKVADPDSSAQRGDPDRWLESAPGGAAQQEFARSVAVIDTLRRVTGVDWQPAGPGSWSYYRRTGHHLGIHRDLAVCDLAVITCVTNDGGSADRGTLRVWPTRANETLEELRHHPAGAVDLEVAAGDTVILLGGVVPHQVLPTGAGQIRIVAPLCYQVVADQPAPSPDRRRASSAYADRGKEGGAQSDRPQQ